MGRNEIGLYGLGVMGRSLAKNFISKGVATSVYAKSKEERERFVAEGEYEVCEDVCGFVASLKKPRVIFIMVTAGAPVDSVMEELLVHLEQGDIIVEGGNSHFSDTQRRCEFLGKQGIKFLGVGVSGGEQGALLGPSMMVGGDQEAWAYAGKLLEKIAARSGDAYCCNYLGKHGAGHYVKMVHNGIEYAIIQIIADIYDIMKRVIGLETKEIADVFLRWRGSEIDSYLIDIAGEVLSKTDDDGLPLVEKILDVAKQKGTGSWTLQEAIERGVYAPSICEAVFVRYVSQNKAFRVKASKILKPKVTKQLIETYEEKLRKSLYFGMLVCYAQGIDLMKKASKDFQWEIDLPLAVSLWREGCIIRSKMLKDIIKALTASNENLLISPVFSENIKLEKEYREVAAACMRSGLAIPTFLSVISYFDSYKTENMNVNMVQGLRDCFGAHTYERKDKAGSFHTNWTGGA